MALKSTLPPKALVVLPDGDIVTLQQDGRIDARSVSAANRDRLASAIEILLRSV